MLITTLHHLPFEQVYFTSMSFFFPWNENRCNIDWIQYNDFSICVKMLLPGGKMSLSQKASTHTQTTCTLKRCSALPTCGRVLLQFVLKLFEISQTYLWHSLKIHFPLLGSSIFYKQQNLIKVKLNIARIIWGKHLSTMSLCPGDINPC